MTEVPFLDVAAHHGEVRDEILAAWSEILDGARFVSGTEVAGFENEFADLLGVDHCVAVSSGTDALTLILRALDVGLGDRVVVPANTFIATAEAVSNVGAEPLLVDCDESRTIAVDAAAAALENACGVIGVHLYGLPADLDGLEAAAAASGAWLVEDAAQAHLATYKGTAVGGRGRGGAFSFYPGKNLGAPGEGGCVTTNDAALAAEIRMLRDHGQRRRYHSDAVGYNARMMELVAAVLRIKLRFLEEWTDRRRRLAARYAQRLDGLPGVWRPAEPAWSESAYHLFVVEVEDRDRVQEALQAAGIGVGLHYPVPIHLQPAYESLGHGPGSFPQAEANAARVLSLPMYPQLTEDQVDHVCDLLEEALAAPDPAP